MKRRIIFIIVGFAILVGTLTFVFMHKGNAKSTVTTAASIKPSPTVKSTPSPTPAPTVTEKPGGLILSITESRSLQVIVNKKRQLDQNYVPDLTDINGAKMRPEAADAMTKLLDAANAAGASMKIVSAYRSYSNQVSTYNGYVSQYGQAKADTFSARPGHSEHQTGLAADLGAPDGNCDLEICFADTTAGKWLAAHAPEYGFIIRYKNGQEAKTGYQYEPWHVRYLGVDVAKAVEASGKTLDDYYGVQAGDYL